MKELSIEQKAKRYDEAIKVAKGNYETIVQMDNDCTFAKEGIVNTFHHIFPELKESEEESIKEWLINLVKGHIEWLEDRVGEQLSNGQVYGDELVKAKNSLAWLEWQGKISDKIVERARTEKQRILVTESDGVANIDWDTRSLQDAKFLMEYGLNYIKKKLEKQGEQKTADNKDYSAPLDIEIPFGAKDSELIQETIRIPDGCYAFIEGNEIVIKKGEKPAWSKEDENNILFLTSIIEECFKDKENITLYGDTICANFTKENVINRLKSFRHQNTWKPSDEQINALEYYIYSTSPTATITKGTIYGNLMVELLEQLKKLKGE